MTFLGHQLHAIMALTAGEWTALVGFMLGSGGIGALLNGVVALRRLNREDIEASRTAARTVAAEETEKALLVYSAAVQRLNEEVLAGNEKMARQDAEMAALRVRVENCERRHAEHMEICPMYRGPLAT